MCCDRYLLQYPGTVIFRLYLSIFYFIHYSRFKQRGSITQVIQLSLCYLAQDAAHNFTASCFWQAFYKLNFIRFGNGANNAANSGRYMLPGKRFIRAGTLVNNIGINTLPFNIVRVTYHRAFYHAGMHVYGILYFGGANAVAAHIQYIIYAAGDAVIAVFVFQCPVAGKI